MPTEKKIWSIKPNTPKIKTWRGFSRSRAVDEWLLPISLTTVLDFDRYASSIFAKIPCMKAEDNGKKIDSFWVSAKSNWHDCFHHIGTGIWPHKTVDQNVFPVLRYWTCYIYLVQFTRIALLIMRVCLVFRTNLVLFFCDSSNHSDILAKKRLNAWTRPKYAPREKVTQ